MSELLTQSAYAKKRGVTHGAVQKAIASGRLVKCLRKTDSGRVMIDVATADAEWASNTDKVKQEATKKGAAPAPAPAAPAKKPAADADAPAPSLAILDGDANVEELDFQEVRTVKEYYLAQAAKLDYEERSAKLIDAEEARRTAFNAARRARDMLLTIPDRVAPVVAGLEDAFQCRQVIAAEIKRVCLELAAEADNDSNQ